MINSPFPILFFNLCTKGLFKPLSFWSMRKMHFGHFYAYPLTFFYNSFVDRWVITGKRFKKTHHRTTTPPFKDKKKVVCYFFFFYRRLNNTLVLRIVLVAVLRKLSHLRSGIRFVFVVSPTLHLADCGLNASFS